MRFNSPNRKVHRFNNSICMFVACQAYSQRRRPQFTPLAHRQYPWMVRIYYALITLNEHDVFYLHIFKSVFIILSNAFRCKAALYYSRNNKLEPKCGGTIISNNFVLTAAHCTRPEYRPVSVEVGKVRMFYSKTSE